MRILVSAFVVAAAFLAAPAQAGQPQLRCYYDCSVGPVSSVTAENGFGEVEHTGRGENDETGKYRIINNSATWLGGIADGKAHGFGKWSEGGYDFYGESKDGRPAGPGLLVVEDLGLMAFGDFKVSSKTIVFDKLEAPTDILQMENGIGGPVIRVNAVSKIGEGFAPLYQTAMAAAIEAFDAEEQANASIRAAKAAAAAEN